MNAIRWVFPLLAIVVAGCASRIERPAAAGSGNSVYGVLVMAHGGSAAWNRAVLDAVQPLAGHYPLEVAFGMADAASLQTAVEKLEARGVERIGVVRLFVSADSFLERTEQILGLRAGAPAQPDGDDGAHADHGMAFWKVETDAEFALSTEGLNEAPEMSAVLADRARALSRDAVREDVLVLAHGAGDEAENRRWLDRIEQLAEPLRAESGFHRVQVATLREDWPEARAAAEREIRAFVARSKGAGRTPLVVPFRVEGFGPYSEVLAGLDYTADGVGLLPHTGVTRWIERQAAALERAQFPSAAAR